jgi:two-component system chemotaxis sensor kinase CheA
VVWNKLPRLVRDVAASCQKRITLEMDGADTGIDRTILEAIKDPLTHRMRNCCDHGIEMPAERERVGKPPAGRLSLRAYYEGGHVNIEIVDDGAGIDPEPIKAKAIQKGLIRQEQAERLSDREAIQLVFLPGFSTAEKVTSISGRGVGMDVVKTNIEKIGGVVDLASTLGQGTAVKIKIPLTLAIIPGLVVHSGGERLVIPQVSLLELARLEGETGLR